MGRLSEPERAVIERYYVEGQSVAEISATLKIAPGTVQSRMWRARRRLAVVAASLVLAVWLLLRGSSSQPEPPPRALSFESLHLQTARLAAPTLSTIEPAPEEPMSWSLEGAVWYDETLDEND